ncbi:hypothetical protein [Zestomonas carbonaria]|uniref:Uncharacterized protein n=1 Tax=Zestomonas carbonaria TaxID=2762745 RepID=A0A7U7ESS3_9GAMM|nr:hypothetical protein [Pseudomonas carbonaria]CAD5110188.1 hypothetical protein PSEWESI4_04506 [Pseudomonas carbonaria]
MDINQLFTSLFTQGVTMDLVRMGIVYAHLIACCVAIGMVIVSDFSMIKKLIGGGSSTQDSDHLAKLKDTVLIALAALWITGLMIIGLDVSIKGMEYFLNPKLQAKILIVTLLTINGFALHQFVMPAMEKAGCILKMAPNARTLAIFAGTVSGVSWLYAALLGIGRPLAWKYSLHELLIAYPLLIAAGFTMMVLLVDWKTSRSKAKPEPAMSYAGILAFKHR